MDEGYYTGCTSMTDLPSPYDDCPTAGVAEPDGVISFGVGSYNAPAIQSNHPYFASWNFDITGGSGAASAYSIGWQETWNFCGGAQTPWCYDGNGAGVLMSYFLTRVQPQFRFWAWRDHSLTGAGDYRYEPESAYYSNGEAYHSGYLSAASSSANFDLYLLKWNGTAWVTVASSEHGSGAETIGFTGDSGLYIWKVQSRSGGGEYQVGISGPEDPSPSLSVTLTSSPRNGSAPLNDVDLTASVGGTAIGTINYTFYCNRADSGTNITPNPAAKFDGITANPKTALDACDYSLPGTYTAKVIAERGSIAAEARTTITVTQPTSQAPLITTSGSSSVTQESATLSLSVNPNGSNTSVWFEWGSGTTFCCSTSQQVVTASAGTSLLSMTVGGLQCNTTYSFRARAQNAGGSATGDTLSFKTGACGSDPQTIQLVSDPSFEGGNNAWWVASPSFYINHGTNFPNPHTGSYYAALATSQGDPGNNLQGGVISPQVTIPSNATSAELRFWYRISTSETTTTTALDTFSFSLVKPGNQQTIVASYSNLDSTGTSYRERVIAVPSSFFGTPIQLFFAGFTNTSNPTVFRVDDVTLSAVLPPSGSSPSVSTGTADQIQATSARLNMTVNANGASTSVWFNLEAGDSTPDDETEHIVIGNGTQSSNVSISAFGLQCGTLYYFRARATNSFGSNSGTVKSFTTSACGGGSPRADTDPALNVTETSATLTADVDANGLPAQAWFAWGPSTSLGQETAHVSVGSGVGFVNFSQTLSGLTCGTDYYFANHVSNSIGQDTGSTASFTTLPCAGGGSAQGFSLDFRRQGCSGSGPAVLLWWTAPPGMGTVFTVRRSDGGYTATVDSSQDGMMNLVSSFLVPGEIYSFSVEGTLNGSPVQTNAVTVPILSDECRLAIGTGDLPHLPLLWTGPPVCSGSTASVPVHWTAVGGATSYTLTRIDNVVGQLTPYPNLTGTSFVDSGLVPGAEYEYMLNAVGAGGSRQTNIISVFVPSGVCAEPSTPGPFSAQISAPVCTAGKGAVTVSWTPASGAASRVTTYWSDDGFASGTTSTSTLSALSIDGIRPGALVKFMTQAEAAAVSGRYRSIIMSQRIPLDLCGAGTAPPTVTAITASYIQERQALLRASIVPNADASVVFFEWGTTTGYGSQTPVRNAGDGYRSVSLGEVLTSLACNTTYHYRAVASNANGTTQGSDGTFTTTSCSPTPVVTVTATDPTATENPMTTGTFLIARTGSTAADLPVTYSVGGTATVGADHTLGAGTVVIPAGSTSRTLTLFPLDDTLVESDETVAVTIQPQSQYTIGTPSSATVTITSDDVAGGDLIFSDGFESGNLCGWGFVSGGAPQCSRSISFAPKVDLQTGTEPLGLVVTDLDGDGRRDIAVTIYTNGSGDHLTIFRNTGTVGHPQFDAPVDISTGRGPEGMAAGDLNNDGKPDLVVANPGDSTISVLRNSSTPGFMNFDSVPLSLSAPPTPHQIAITDFDGDGKSDLIFTSNNGRLVAVFHHASDPNTIAFDYRRDYSADGYLNDLTVTDIDRDTKPEILIPITDTGLLTVFQNTSSPGNVQASALPPLAAGTAPIRGIAAGDLNNDRAADVINSAVGGVEVFQNSSSPGVFNLSRTDLPTGTNPDAVAIGDLDNNGLSDVVVANPSDNTLIVLRNASTGSPIILTPLALRPITGLNPINLILGDVNGDGWLDIIVANHDGNSVSIFLNTTGNQ